MNEEAHKGGSDKLEWMYKGPGNSVDREEYLLGKSVSNSSTLVGVKNEVERDCLPTPFLGKGASTPDSAILVSEQVDIARKIHEDPLLAIKKKEIEKRQQLLKNPVKMKKLQDLLEKQKRQTNRSVSSEKSRRKKSKKRKEEDSDSDSSDVDKALKKKYKKLKLKFGLEDLRDLSNNSRKKHKSSDVKSADRTNKFKKTVSDKAVMKKHKKDISDSSSSDDSVDSSSCSETSTDDSDTEKETKRKSDKYEDRKHKDRTYRDFKDDSSRRHNQDDGDKKYGLLLPASKMYKNDREYDKSRSKTSPQVTTKVENSRTKEKFVRPKPVKLSEREKEAKLKEMMKNAEWRNELRNENVKRYKDRDEKEKRKEKGYSEEFYRKQLSYAASNSSVEGRIKSNINHIQRTASDMDKNFAKR